MDRESQGVKRTEQPVQGSEPKISAFQFLLSVCSTAPAKHARSPICTRWDSHRHRCMSHTHTGALSHTHARALTQTQVHTHTLTRTLARISVLCFCTLTRSTPSTTGPGVAGRGTRGRGEPPAPPLGSSLPLRDPIHSEPAESRDHPGSPPRPRPSRSCPRPFKSVITHYYTRSRLYWGRRGGEPGERSGRRGGGGERGRAREREGECEREQSLPLPEEGSD